MADDKMPIEIDSYPTIFVRSELEQSDAFQWNFMEQGIPYRLIVLTGGCELSPEHVPGLANIQDALAGRVNGQRQENLPVYEGYAVFGGTRYKRASDPHGHIPGITEVLPGIQDACPNARFVGVVAKSIRKMRYIMPLGLMVHREFERGKPKGWKKGDDEKFTVVHPTAKSIMLIQKTVDQVSESPWWDEAKERYGICRSFVETGHPAMLLAYNGGGITEKEIDLYAEAGLPVLLIRGSGRAADKVLANERFMASFPNVQAADNDVESIRSKLVEMGFLRQKDDGEEPNK